jgi:hypothetical protein
VSTGPEASNATFTCQFGQWVPPAEQLACARACSSLDVCTGEFEVNSSMSSGLAPLALRSVHHVLYTNAGAPLLQTLQLMHRARRAPTGSRGTVSRHAARGSRRTHAVCSSRPLASAARQVTSPHRLLRALLDSTARRRFVARRRRAGMCCTSVAPMCLDYAGSRSCFGVDDDVLTRRHGSVTLRQDGAHSEPGRQHAAGSVRRGPPE